MKLNVLNRDIKETKEKLKKIKQMQLQCELDAKISILCKMKDLEYKNMNTASVN
jgi:hypothetical protein